MRRLSQLSLVLGLLLWGPSAYAQSVRYQSQAISSRGAGIANATIAVCTQPANTNTQPCSPLATLATSTSTTSGGANPLTADSFGNFFFYVAPGRYTVQIYGPAVFGQLVIPDVEVGSVAGGSAGVFSSFTAGSGNTFAPVTFSNHNNQYWAGPGATPTIDQAVTACGALPGCIVHISPGYTGPESVNLITNSIGYEVYVGVNNITIQDYRSCPGTPGNGFACPIYGAIWGGRLAGQRNRMGVSYVAHNETDSAAGATSFIWVDGTLPSNGGGLSAGINGMELHDTVTVGASVTEISAVAAEIDANATSADNPINSSYGVVSGINFSRVAAAQNILYARAYGAKTCSNAVSAPAKMFYCYGYYGFNQTGGTYRNFTFVSQGDWLSENGTNFWAEDFGISCTETASPNGATESGQTVTLTLTGACAAATPGQHIKVSGNAVTGYNIDAIVLTGAGGTTLTYFAPGTNNLAGSGGGTVQPFTPRIVQRWTNGNTVVFNPLSDTNGWRFRKQDNVTDIVQITNAGVFAAGILGCTNNNTCNLGGGGTAPNALFMFETTAPSGVAGDDACYGDSTAHALKCSYNNGSFFNVTQTVGTGNVTTAGTAVATLTCQTQTGITVTGAATTDNVIANIGAALPATWQTGITMQAHVTATNTVTVYLCNPTATANITPAATQVNVRVVR